MYQNNNNKMAMATNTKPPTLSAIIPMLASSSTVVAIADEEVSGCFNKRIFFSIHKRLPIFAEWNFPLLSIGPVHFRCKGCRVVFFLF